MLLEKPTPKPSAIVADDMTESQLTKVYATGTSFGWDYTFTASLEMVYPTSHSYTYHMGCTHSCSSDDCSHSCDGHCGDYSTNSIEVSWFHKAKDEAGDYSLKMESSQWSVHARATNGADKWRQKNQVLPGGALYQLSTPSGTETTVKSVIYSTIVDPDSRAWQKVSDPNKYTSASVVKSIDDYLKEAEESLENFRVVQWVNSNPDLTSAWENTAGSVVIKDGGESLSALGTAATNASTDAKYRLVDGTVDNNKTSFEADLDIVRRHLQATLYKGFTDHDGNIYIAQLTGGTTNKALTTNVLDDMINAIKDLNGTKQTNVFANGCTFKLIKIGTKGDNKQKILNNIQSGSGTNYLYVLDSKTGFISNLIDSVERNTGNDKDNATWTTDGKWYNEAYDGYYVLQYTVIHTMGLGVPNRRIGVLDPNLCPAKSGMSDMYSKAFISQFRLDPKSTVRKDKVDGYLGLFEGSVVALPDSENMYISRPFYIPNVNVQDLT